MSNPFSSLKAVFFDLDDTLFDHLQSTRQGLQAVCQAYPRLQRRPLDELFLDYTRLLDEIHLRVLEGSLTIDEARRERFRRFFLLNGLESTAEIVHHAATLHRDMYQASRQVVAHVIPLLEYLHGKVNIAVVTNNIRAEQMEKLAFLKLTHLVDVLVTSEEARSIKPDQGIFHLALQRVGCQAEETVMIGDAWHADVLGARNAGIRAIWLNRTGMPCPDPDLARELRSFDPLQEVVEMIFGPPGGASRSPEAKS